MAGIIREAPLRSKLEWFPADGLDVGAYDEAAKQGKTLSMWLEELRAQHTGDAAYVGLTKREVMKRQKMQKEADPASVKLTAFQECLKAAGIRAFGSYTDTVEKFFEYADTDVLFPEFFSDRVHAGMLLASLVPEFTMGESVIDSTSYHRIYLEDSEADRKLSEVVPGEEFPETKIAVSRESVYLSKYGRYVSVTYEDIKFQRLNVFGRALERIGQQIDIDRTDRLIQTLINNVPSENTMQPAVSGQMNTADVIKWATLLPGPYRLDKQVGRKQQLRVYYGVLANFTNPQATWGFVGINLPRSFEWDRSALAEDYLLGVDSRYAIEHITTGAVITETEKLIRKQIQGTAVSHRDAFAVFDAKAIALLDGSY